MSGDYCDSGATFLFVSLPLFLSLSLSVYVCVSVFPRTWRRSNPAFFLRVSVQNPPPAPVSRASRENYWLNAKSYESHSKKVPLSLSLGQVSLMLLFSAKLKRTFQDRGDRWGISFDRFGSLLHCGCLRLLPRKTGETPFPFMTVKPCRARLRFGILKWDFTVGNNRKCWVWACFIPVASAFVWKPWGFRLCTSSFFLVLWDVSAFRPNVCETYSNFHIYFSIFLCQFEAFTAYNTPPTFHLIINK